MASEMASTNAQPQTADALAEERKKMEYMIKIHNKRETAWLNETEKLLGRNHSLENENADIRSKFQESVVSQKEKNDQVIQSMKEMEEKAVEDMKNKDEHIEELDEKLAKKNNEYRNEIKGKEEEYAALVSKFEESVENEKKKDDRIKELEQNLKEEGKKRQELETINDELEDENYKWTEETNQKNKDLREQINKVEKESRENTIKMQTSNEVLKAEFEKQKNAKEALEIKNEELDEQIIVQKMKVRKLEDNHEHHATELAKTIEGLTKKSDHYENKCKTLNEEIVRLGNAEKQMKTDFNTEKIQLNQALEIVNYENEILRQRLNELSDNESSAVRSRKNRMVPILSVASGPRTGSRTGSRKGSSTKSSAPLNQANAQQWNSTDEGRRENTIKMQTSNEVLKAEFEKQKNAKETLEKKNEELGEQINVQKMKLRKLEDNHEHHGTDIQQLEKMIEALTRKSDHYENKCKDLNEEIVRLGNAEKQMKTNFNTEKIQLNQALEVLNNENEILRQRVNEPSNNESSAVRSGNDVSHMMPRLSDVSGPRTGSSDHHGTSTESSAPLNQANAQQWYSTDKGNKILDEILKKLKELFPLTELSKKINSQDIVIEIKADPVQVRFPSDFPNSPLKVMRGDKEKIIPIYQFAYNTASSHASFVHHVVSTLSTLM